MRTVAEVEERHTRHRGTARLWYGVLAGAFAWKFQLMTNYILVPYACWEGLSWLMHLTSFAFLALALSGAWVAWGSWRESTGDGDELDSESDWILGRTRFMAGAGVMLSGLLALVILAQWLPGFFLDPCFVGS